MAFYKIGLFTDSSPWTTEEQKLLEQALKTYPVNTPERWEKIAAAVPGRSKKDCMKRYKVGNAMCLHPMIVISLLQYPSSITSFRCTVAVSCPTVVML